MLVVKGMVGMRGCLAAKDGGCRNLDIFQETVKQALALGTGRNVYLVGQSFGGRKRSPNYAMHLFAMVVRSVLTVGLLADSAVPFTPCSHPRHNAAHAYICIVPDT